jgi:hypothetical protein
MGFGHFDAAQLSVVGYAHVLPDGTSPDCNSGSLAIQKVGTGIYTVVLPASQKQANNRVFFQVTPIGSQVFHWVQNVSDNLRAIIFTSSVPAPTDAEFQLVVLRTIDPPPDGAPA